MRKKNLTAVIVLLGLLIASPAWADNVLIWVNESPTASVSIEQLGLSGFVEIATVAPGVATYVHQGVDEGCYKVRAYLDTGLNDRQYSGYSNTACKLEAPSTLTVQ